MLRLGLFSLLEEECGREVGLDAVSGSVSIILRSRLVWEMGGFLIVVEVVVGFGIDMLVLRQACSWIMLIFLILGRIVMTHQSLGLVSLVIMSGNKFF